MKLPKLTRDELVEVTRKLMTADVADEFESNYLTNLFNTNIGHPSGSDLIFYPEIEFKTPEDWSTMRLRTSPQKREGERTPQTFLRRSLCATLAAMDDRRERQPRSNADESRDSSPSGTAIALLFGALAVALVGGYFFIMKLIDMGRTEDCLMSGRRDCVQIDMPVRR